jgi:hypothetical protein
MSTGTRCTRSFGRVLGPGCGVPDAGRRRSGLRQLLAALGVRAHQLNGRLRIWRLGGLNPSRRTSPTGSRSPGATAASTATAARETAAASAGARAAPFKAAQPRDRWWRCGQDCCSRPGKAMEVGAEPVR